MGSVRSARQIADGMQKKHFRRENNGDHVVFIFTNKNGSDCDVKTKVSHGALSNTIGVNLISLMARQCHLTKQQFLDFVDCRLSEEEYREILREKGFDV